MEALNKRQAQALRTKSLIYDVAIELIEKKGYATIKIQDICQKSNVSVGTFYHYYKSKSDILAEFYKKADEHFLEHQQDILKSNEVTEQIVDFFVFYAKYNERIGIDLMKELYNSDNKMFIQKGRHMQTILNQLVQKGQARNLIVSIYSSEEITTQIFVFIRGQVYDWCLNDGSYDLEIAIEKSIRLILSIYLKE